MQKVLVLGGTGQLGKCLESISNQFPELEIRFLSRESADLLDQESLNHLLEDHKPNYCINCAAYTAVDQAEDEPDKAMNINRDGVVNLSYACLNYEATLIHLSTDFVFSGTSVTPLSEMDEVNPVNIYGQTKAEGEKAIQDILSNYFIIRTSWLYSEYGNNFVKTMMRLGKERDELKVIWDQAGTPTYAIDLANCLLKIISTGNKQYGIYHYSNEGITSWYDFAEAIFELCHLPTRVIPVRTSEYYTKAVRPQYSVLDKSKIKNNLKIKIPHWRESLKRCIGKL